MTDLKSIQVYMKSDSVIQRFEELVGKSHAMAYVTSVLLAVATNDALQECIPESVYTSAIRAATLRLSCDPSTKQAYLVPFKGKATLVVGYKGLMDMGVRTNKYRYINVGPVYEGETIIEDRITGFHRIEGAKSGDSVIGYIGAFELLQGYAKTYYMTVDEIIAHAKKYSKGFDNPKGAWKTATDQMLRKTVLRRMLDQWGYLDPIDAQLLHQIEVDDTNGDTAPVVIDEKQSETNGNEHHTPDEILRDLGYDQFEQEPEPENAPMTLEDAQNMLSSKGERYGDLDDATLKFMANAIAKSKVHKPEHDTKTLAIQTILKSRAG